MSLCQGLDKVIRLPLNCYMKLSLYFGFCPGGGFNNRGGPGAMRGRGGRGRGDFGQRGDRGGGRGGMPMRGRHIDTKNTNSI